MRARTFQAVIFAMFIAPIGGCGTTSEQKLAAVERAVTYLRAESSKMDQRLATLDEFITRTTTALSDPNIAGSVTAAIREELLRAQAEKPAVLAAKAKADQVLADLQANAERIRAGGQVDAAALLRLAAQTLGGVGTAVGGSAGGWLQVVAMIVMGLLGAGGAGKALVATGKLANANTALQEVVSGGETFKDSLPANAPMVILTDDQAEQALNTLNPEQAAAVLRLFKSAHDETQSPDTQAAVARVRAA
jgi:hypothetical protein